jgi:glycosyltransferase involved in cell wall biosynthesis
VKRDPPDLRTAMLLPCYWPEVTRGTERLAHDLSKGLIARGHSPVLVTSHPAAPERGIDDGIPIIRHWRPPDARLRRRLYEDYLTHVPFSYLSLIRGDWDIAQAFFHTDALAALRWSRKTGRPWVLAHMGIPDLPGITSRRYRAQIVERVSTGADAVTALSQTARDAFARWLGVEARVIYPPVDLDGFPTGTERTPEPTIVCAADPDVPRKRVGLLVEALGHVRRERPGAELVIGRPSASRRADELARVDGVTLVDPDVLRAELPARYATAWASVLPSVGEAFGLVLVEGLAAGTPAVGSDNGGITEIVDSDRVGRLFAGDDPRHLARALLEAFELAQTPSTRSACRKRAEDFSLDRCAATYEALYRELLA